MGERYYAFYWNQGYIHCLKENRIVDTYEGGRLFAYNEKVNMMESLEIGMRKDKIKKEESKRMELEGIKKRIDESIGKCSTVILTSSDICTADIVGKINEGHKALCLYKEFIEECEKIRNPFYDIGIIINKLEDKYYPRPKPKTIKEKIAEIKESIANYAMSDDMTEPTADALLHLLDKIED